MIIKHFNKITNIELYEIIKARIKVFSIEQNCIYQDLDDKDLDAYHLFIQDNNKVIAYLRILNKGVSYKESSIGRVLVDADYRNKGLAKKILSEAIKFLEKELNECEIRISAQEYIVPFYMSMGFKKVSDIYLEDHLPHIEMLYKK